MTISNQTVERCIEGCLQCLRWCAQCRAESLNEPAGCCIRNQRTWLPPSNAEVREESRGSSGFRRFDSLSFEQPI